MSSYKLLPYIEQLKLGDVKFINQPSRYTIEQYQLSIQKVVSYISKYDNVLAIYQIGGTSSLGISDIDLIVVFADDIKSFNHSYRQLFNIHDSYLFMHSIYGMPASIFKMKELLIPIYRYKVLYGYDIPHNTAISSVEKKALSKIFAVEYLIFNLYNLSSQFYLKQLKVRNLLCSFHALIYDLEILCDSELRHEIEDFNSRVSNLRETWWDNEYDSISNFFMLCKETVELILKVLIKFSDDIIINEMNNTAKLYFSFGSNGYIKEYPQNSDCNISIRIDEKRIINLLDKITDYIPPNKIKKQLLDFRTTLYAITLSLPSNLISFLYGYNNSVYGIIYKKRQLQIESYLKFMKKINPEYGIFDIFRWHCNSNLKWNMINFINKYLFIDRLR